MRIAFLCFLSMLFRSFVIAENMALPYGLPQRCLQAVAACWLISAALSFVSVGSSLVLFAYLAVVALPAVAIYSFMNASLQAIISQLKIFSHPNTIETKHVFSGGS
jgi:hypothetical protein